MDGAREDGSTGMLEEEEECDEDATIELPGPSSLAHHPGQVMMIHSPAHHPPAHHHDQRQLVGKPVYHIIDVPGFHALI